MSHPGCLQPPWPTPPALAALAKSSVCCTPFVDATTPGRVYKLHMTNPSALTHYFTSLEFADKVRIHGWVRAMLHAL